MYKWNDVKTASVVCPLLCVVRNNGDGQVASFSVLLKVQCDWQQKWRWASCNGSCVDEIAVWSAASWMSSKFCGCTGSVLTALRHWSMMSCVCLKMSTLLHPGGLQGACMIHISSDILTVMVYDQMLWQLWCLSRHWGRIWLNVLTGVVYD